MLSHRPGLAGNISFFQSVCVLGYCVFPMCIAALLCQLAQLLLAGGLVDMLLRAAIALGGSAWSTRASGAYSRRRDCHFTGIPSPSILKHLLKVEGGAAE